MKALELVGKQQLQFVEVDRPRASASEVLLRIKKVGICGTDLHLYHGGMDASLPLIMGHEFVGVVEQVGAGVQTVQIGQMVVAEHVIGCGHCEYCIGGRKNLCLTPTVLGLHRAGALAEYMVVPAELVYPLPKGLTYDQGVLVEPLSIALYGVRKAGAIIGRSVAVVGQGPIGLFVDQVAKAAGARVFGIDIMPSRLQFALEHGYVDGVINSAHEHAAQTYQKQSGESAADVVFEVVGQESTMRLAFDLVRPGGIIVVLGVFEHDVAVSMMTIVKREIQIIGSWTCLNTFEPAIQLLKNDEIDTDQLISHRYPFSQAVKAFQDASSYAEDRIKTVIEFP